MKPFFVQRVQHLQRLERLLYVLVVLLLVALALQWVNPDLILRLKAMPHLWVYIILGFGFACALGLALALHRRVSSWLDWLYNLIDRTADALIIADADGNIVYANRSAQHLSGYSLSDMQAMKLADIVPLEQLHSSTADDATASQSTTAREVHLRAKSSELIPVEVALRSIRIGKDKFIALTAHDMRDAVMHREQQTRLYRRLEAMYGIAAALSELTDLDEILDRGLELSMQALNADCGRIYMLDDGGTLHLVRYRGISDEFAEAVAELRYGVGNVGTVAKTLRPSLVNYATSQSQHRDACLAEGLCCSAFAALKIGDKVYGVVAFSYRRPLDWTNEEMSLLEAVGEELGVAIQRAQLYDRLRTSREWYRNLFLLASDGIWVLDADGNILDANRALEQAMRVPMGDLRGKSVYEFLEASHIDAVRRWLDDILRGEQFKPQQLTLRIDGGVRTFEVHGARITDAMGKPLALCILHDITTRVRHAQMREALDSIRARIERQRSVETMLMTLTEYLASELHWFNALLLFKPASAQVEKLVVAWHQECEHGGTGVRRLIIGEPQLTTALLSECFRAMQMRKPLVLHRSSDAVREFMKRCGLSTPDDTSIFSLSFIIPLISPERTLGLLIISGEDLLHEDLELCQVFADQLAAILENAALYEELQHAKERLEELVEQRTAQLQALYELSQEAHSMARLPDVLDKVVQAVCKIVPCAAVGIFGRIEDDMFATIRIADGVAEQATEALMREMILHYEHEATEKVNISTLQFNVERAEGKRLPSTVTKWGDDDLILLPLRGQDEIMGVLAVGQHPLERMDADHNAFLQSLADQASLILHRLHSAAIAQRAQLTAVLDALGTGIVVLTADRKIVTANQVARRMLAELNPAGEHQALEMLKVWDLVERAKENAPQPIAMDINIAGRYYEVTVSQWTLEASHGNRFAVSIRDVTKERLSQQQLIETGRLAALGELASGIAHEINNPLTAVVGFAELWLDREELDDQLRADLAKIYQAGMRARDIVHRLLIFARGVQEEKAHDVIDIPAVVDQALDLIAAQFRSAGIKLVRDYQRDLPVIVASQSLLQQVLLNLVQNAKDAIEMSGKGSQVIVRVQRADKEYIRIVVEDDGPGIPEEVRDKIYNPFFTTKPPGKGTGLGLSITYKHVQDMGGQIRFSTQEGVGTRFEVLIPIMSPEILPEVESEEEPQTPKAPFPARLLVVDDEPAILSLVQQGLTAYGYEVTTISDPREVIPCLTEHQFDVILLDLRMPHINGRELYEKIKKQFPEQAERVVFLTGDILGDAAREGQIAGRPTILKPLGAAELAQFLSQWLTEISQTPSSQSNAGGTQVN